MAEGHIHEGGIQVDLFLNNRYLCSSKATYSPAVGSVDVSGKQWRSITGMTICPGPMEVKKGDFLEVNAQYDFSKYSL